MTIDPGELRVAVVSTFPPTRCGVGKFSHDLCRVWRALAPLDLRVYRIVTGSDVMVPDELVEAVFDPASPVAVRAVARHLDRADVTVVHHEYGLYGPREGEAVVDLVQDVGVPVVSVLHTVLTRPTAQHRRIVEALGANGPLLVFTPNARRCLLETHEVEREAVRVVNHGTNWTPTPIRPRPRRRLVSWGLLGPGKGIERALEALSLIDLDPPVTYDIIGQTHPRVRDRGGEGYRHSLQELTRNLGLERRVRFVDRYLPEAGLIRRVAEADLAVLPYDDPDQLCSGTLVDALGAGRPVVATSFPHARELLDDGAGRAVEPSPYALAAAIVELLENEDAYQQAAYRASRRAAEHAWERVSASYVEAIHQARAGVGVD